MGLHVQIEHPPIGVAGLRCTRDSSSELQQIAQLTSLLTEQLKQLREELKSEHISSSERHPIPALPPLPPLPMLPSNSLLHCSASSSQDERQADIPLPTWSEG